MLYLSHIFWNAWKRSSTIELVKDIIRASSLGFDLPVFNLWRRMNRPVHESPTDSPVCRSWRISSAISRIITWLRDITWIYKSRTQYIRVSSCWCVIREALEWLSVTEGRPKSRWRTVEGGTRNALAAWVALLYLPVWIESTAFWTLLLCCSSFEDIWTTFEGAR